MKNAFYFMLKALFVFETFKFFARLFSDVEKQLDQKASVYSKMYDVIDWATDNYNTPIAQYLKKQRQQDNEIWSINRTYQEKYFTWKIFTQNVVQRLLVPDFFRKSNFAFTQIDSRNCFHVCFVSKWRSTKIYKN